MKGYLGQTFLSFVRKLSSFGGSKCIKTVKNRILWTSSCVLWGEVVLIPEYPLSPAAFFVERLSSFWSIHYQRFYCVL